jgi:nuclear mRNA export protein SAC3
MGFLADPDKKTTLDQAITPVGTCEEMCPQFERVERMVQFMVDRSEKVGNIHSAVQETY